MKILGIDPGLKATGYGLIEIEGTAGQAIGLKDRHVKLLEVGIIEPPSTGLLPQKVERIYRNLNEIVSEYKPDVMVLEKIYSHYKHPATACILGHARGVICLLSAQRGIRLVEHSVKRIRTALLGNGNASKEQTRRVVANLLRFKPESVTLDASDALALALGFAQMNIY